MRLREGGWGQVRPQSRVGGGRSRKKLRSVCGDEVREVIETRQGPTQFFCEI